MAGGNTTTRVVQVTNIAPQATKDQMQCLFGNIGKIEEIRLYPTIRDVSCPVSSRICYVKFSESSFVAVAQHLTNTVFIDRALIVIPVLSGIIPDEYKALEMSSNGTIVPGLHTPDSKLPPEVINRIDGMVPNQVVKTSDPKLEQNNLPEYPALPVNFDARKIEETRRTILISDIRSDWKLEDIMDHFAQAGEIKYARFCDKDCIRYAMLEFTQQKSIIEALKMQGSEYRGYLLNLQHSTQPIQKPEAKSNEAAQREIEEAMTIVKEAHNMLSAAIDPVIGLLTKEKSSSSRRRTRSRSRERRHSRSRSRRRSRSRKRSRSRSKARGRRSRSRSKRRSRSHSKSSTSRSKRSRSGSRRSPSRSKKERSRSRSKHSRSRDRRKRSRSRRRSRSRSRTSRSHKSRSKSRRRSKSRERKSSRSHRKEEKHRRSRTRSKSKRRSRSRTRSSRSKDAKGKRRSRTPKKLKRIHEEVQRDYDAEERIGMEEIRIKKSGRGHHKQREEKSTSPDKSDNMDISNSP